MSFRLSTARHPPRAKKRTNILGKPASKSEQIGLIYGQKPDSLGEWFIAQALWNLGQSFQYQVEFFGGHDGGFVVDFIVTSVVPMLPIEYVGRYWHRDLDEEEYRRILIEQRLGVEIKYIAEEQATTYELALQTVRTLL